MDGEWSYWKSLPAVVFVGFILGLVIGDMIGPISGKEWLGYLVGFLIGSAFMSVYVFIKYRVMKAPWRTGWIWERHGKRRKQL